MRQAHYGSPANHSILLDDLLCNGTERNLLSCLTYLAVNIGNTDCTHLEDAGVRCEGKLYTHYWGNLYVTVRTALIILHIP